MIGVSLRFMLIAALKHSKCATVTWWKSASNIVDIAMVNPPFTALPPENARCLARVRERLIRKVWRDCGAVFS
jgi:hypothetical protein